MLSVYVKNTVKNAKNSVKCDQKCYVSNAYTSGNSIWFRVYSNLTHFQIKFTHQKFHLPNPNNFQKKFWLFMVISHSTPGERTAQLCLLMLTRQQTFDFLELIQSKDVKCTTIKIPPFKTFSIGKLEV